MTTWALEFKNVSYKYPRTSRKILSNINLKVPMNSFQIIVGPTGSGKSTLLKIARLLYKEYGGEFHGNIYVFGEDVGILQASNLGSKVAIVFQNPAYQLHQPRVIDEIMSAPIYQNLPWNECLERAQYSANEILGGKLLSRNPGFLSVGEQQKVALASSLTMKADIILLDEPFSYLDTKATYEFLEVLKKLKAQGMTILLATHHIEPVAHLADSITLLDQGKIIISGPPREILYSNEFHHSLGRPLFIEAGIQAIKEDRLNERPICWTDFIERFQAMNIDEPIHKVSSETPRIQKEAVVEVNDLSYTYPNSNRGVFDISLTIEKGEIFGFVGSNGSGKSTLAKLILSLLKPSNGHVIIFGKKNIKISDIASEVGYVSQNPSDMIFETTVSKECSFGPISQGKSDPYIRVEAVLSKLGLLKYADRDPRSLSGGEQRLLSIANALVNDVDLLILDEPEFGLDFKSFKSISSIVYDLRDEGKTFILITQNLEAALFMCDRIALISEGRILRIGNAIDICCNNKLLKKAGLKYPPLFTVYEYILDQYGYSLDEQAFLEALVSKIWS